MVDIANAVRNFVTPESRTIFFDPIQSDLITPTVPTDLDIYADFLTDTVAQRYSNICKEAAQIKQLARLPWNVDR